MDRFEGIVRSQSYSLTILDHQAAPDKSYPTSAWEQPEQGQQEHMILLSVHAWMIWSISIGPGMCES